MRRIDLVPLRRFFLGVLGWTPRTLMQEARLEDLKDALDGYAEHHGLARQKPSKDFLQRMMGLFPDQHPEKEHDVI